MLGFYYHKQPYKSIMLQDGAVFVELVGHLELPSWVTSLKGAAPLPSSLSVPAWQKEKPAPIKNWKRWKYLTVKNCAMIEKTTEEAEGEKVKGTKCRERKKEKEELRSIPPCFPPG